MPHWVKRNIIWQQPAIAEAAELKAGANRNRLVATLDAVERYAASGRSDNYDIAYFSTGPWRGHWRVKNPQDPASIRLLFVDHAARRQLHIVRVRLRPTAYADPPV